MIYINQTMHLFLFPQIFQGDKLHIFNITFNAPLLIYFIPTYRFNIGI